MFNDRPIEDPRLQAALDEVQAIYRRYDLAGAVMLVSEDDAAFAYPLYTTWNAVIEDPTVQPLGFRFRVKQAEQGVERAQALMLGTAHMLCQLHDFGVQTRIWMGDLLSMLRQAGIRIQHTPFNGRKLPRLSSRP
jgi:hypothetical protein